ncbi:hypothetical protein TSMEX_007596 [Taenia solium]|eukprot:TsM_000447400 transcript=TsM_000447400 gene=TsM_000447400
MHYFEKFRGVNLFSRSLILFSFLLNLSVAIFAYYCLAWIYIQRGVVEGGAYQINITDLYLSRYPEDLNRLIEMSRHFEENVNMSRRHTISFQRQFSLERFAKLPQSDSLRHCRPHFHLHSIAYERQHTSDKLK